MCFPRYLSSSWGRGRHRIANKCKEGYDRSAVFHDNMNMMLVGNLLVIRLLPHYGMELTWLEDRTGSNIRFSGYLLCLPPGPFGPNSCPPVLLRRCKTLAETWRDPGLIIMVPPICQEGYAALLGLHLANTSNI